MTSELIKGTVECEVCKKKAECESVEGDGRLWEQPPQGWFCSDSYPPGDIGTLWRCSLACAATDSEEYKRKNQRTAPLKQAEEW